MSTRYLGLDYEDIKKRRKVNTQERNREVIATIAALIILGISMLSTFNARKVVVPDKLENYPLVNPIALPGETPDLIMRHVMGSLYNQFSPEVRKKEFLKYNKVWRVKPGLRYRIHTPGYRWYKINVAQFRPNKF